MHEQSTQEARTTAALVLSVLVAAVATGLYFATQFVLFVVLSGLATGATLFFLHMHLTDAAATRKRLHRMIREKEGVALQSANLADWRRQVEEAQKEAREANQSRRGLERRITDLERELAETQTKRDEARRSNDRERKRLGEAVEKAMLEAASLRDERDALLDERAAMKSDRDLAIDQRDSTMEALKEARAENQTLTAHLEMAQAERDRYREKLAALALNAKQIQVIVEDGLMGPPDDDGEKHVLPLD